MSLREKIKIMVVDDMATSRGLIINSLNEMGIKNYTFENSGDDAFKAIQTAPVHLILSDHNMPGMSGIDLLKAVRTDEKTARTGFILITGSPDPKLVQTGASLQRLDYLTQSLEALSSIWEKLTDEIPEEWAVDNEAAIDSIGLKDLAAKLKGVMTPQAQVSSETSGSLEEF